MDSNISYLTHQIEVIVHALRNSIPWRTVHNLFCTFPSIRRCFFPIERQAMAFGPNDTEYAWSSFETHLNYLNSNGFRGAKKFMEIGPGRNLGTALLWYVHEMSRYNQKEKISGFLWDVYPNANPTEQTWPKLAFDLLNNRPDNVPISIDALHILQDIAKGLLIPEIFYIVCPLSLLKQNAGDGFDLIYSTVALEHVWHITQAWELLAQITACNGWHAHRIDLADHSCRETNYNKMLEYSSFTYWFMFRFIPGAVNRWRASHHINFLKKQGFEILFEKRGFQQTLPHGKKQLAKPYCYLNDAELLATQLDFVARKSFVTV